MSRAEKLLKKFLNKPESLKFKKIEKILFFLGFTKINIKGSHHLYCHPLITLTLSIPVHNNDCKDIYKKETADIINKIISNEN